MAYADENSDSRVTAGNLIDRSPTESRHQPILRWPQYTLPKAELAKSVLTFAVFESVQQAKNFDRNTGALESERGRKRDLTTLRISGQPYWTTVAQLGDIGTGEARQCIKIGVFITPVSPVPKRHEFDIKRLFLMATEPDERLFVEAAAAAEHENPIGMTFGTSACIRSGIGRKQHLRHSETAINLARLRGVEPHSQLLVLRHYSGGFIIQAVL
ncbi:MAG: hypothetical protein WAM99_06125 [Xanthobacteraceae bacterium]